MAGAPKVMRGHINGLYPSRFLSLSLPSQYVQRRQQENTQRQSRGEPPLPEEDLTKLFKPPQPPPRMDSLLIAGQFFYSSHTAKLFSCKIDIYSKKPGGKKNLIKLKAGAMCTFYLILFWRKKTVVDFHILRYTLLYLTNQRVHG